ncbi:MAG: hypothetical protein WC460_04020 [Patescibacteria group bacterium]
MGIKFGEVDSSQIIENEFRINVLERVIEFMANNQGVLPSIVQLNEIRKEVARLLKTKYPNSIKLPE